MISWQENKMFADIICEGLNQEDIENLEALADAFEDDCRD